MCLGDEEMNMAVAKFTSGIIFGDNINVNVTKCSYIINASNGQIN